MRGNADYLKSYGWHGKRKDGKILYSCYMIKGEFTIEQAMKIQEERNQKNMEEHKRWQQEKTEHEMKLQADRNVKEYLKWRNSDPTRENVIDDFLEFMEDRYSFEQMNELIEYTNEFVGVDKQKIKLGEQELLKRWKESCQ